VLAGIDCTAVFHQDVGMLHLRAHRVTVHAVNTDPDMLKPSSKKLLLVADIPNYRSVHVCAS
jgi:hypothetical protein